jgi:hypothetical protein
MLASLYFFRCNPTMDELAVILRKNTVTIRKHVWEFIGHLAALEMVSDHGTYPWLTWTDPANIVQIACSKHLANLRRMTSHPHLRADPPLSQRDAIDTVPADDDDSSDDESDAPIPQPVTIDAIVVPLPDQVGE